MIGDAGDFFENFSDLVADKKAAYTWKPSMLMPI